jgi:hypothetical protein
MTGALAHTAAALGRFGVLVLFVFYRRPLFGRFIGF